MQTFNDPEQALSGFRPNLYDFIILDIRMPRINGFDLARAIWLKDPTARVCFLTAFEIYEQEARKVFKNLNYHCFLEKPTSIAKLVQQIESHKLAAQ